MTTLIWRSAYSYLPPIADGGTMDVCRVGQIEVGRVQRIGTRGALSALPTASGPWIWLEPAKASPAPKQLSLFGGEG